MIATREDFNNEYAQKIYIYNYDHYRKRAHTQTPDTFMMIYIDLDRRAREPHTYIW